MGKFLSRYCKQCSKKFEPNSCKQIFCGDICRRRYYSIERDKLAAERAAKKNLSLTDIAIEARKAGMTYGEYVAKNGL